MNHQIPNALSRNIGLITEEDQFKIINSKVVVCGVGGMGGVCAEVLVRMGVGFIRLVDHDKFEDTNFNRQIHSNTENVGKYKAEVLKSEFLKINPNLKVEVLTEGVSLSNVNEILDNVDFVVNGMDDMLASIILERTARIKEKSIVDAWITPFASVFVTKKDSKDHWEEYLNFVTQHKSIKDITKEDCLENLKKEIDFTLSHFDPYKYISKEKVKRVISNQDKRPSFPIVVWLSGILMANEVFKLVCDIPTASQKGIFLDQYTYEIIKY